MENSIIKMLTQVRTSRHKKGRTRDKGCYFHVPKGYRSKKTELMLRYSKGKDWH